MTRVLNGAGAGVAVCLLALVAGGAVYGYTDGLPTARLSPGREAAVKTAFIVTVYFWWLAVGLGAVGGGLAALASGFVARTRRPVP